MKIRTADLTGAQLDYHTARAQCAPAEHLEIRRVPRTDTLICVLRKLSGAEHVFNPHDNWHLAGALLEQHMPALDWVVDPVEWYADIAGVRAEGPTPQVAICRAVVRAAFGEEVEEVAVCE